MAAQIPLRNIWLLFLYAADLVHFKDQWKVTPESAKNLPDLVARLLVHVVEQRLRRKAQITSVLARGRSIGGGGMQLHTMPSDGGPRLGVQWVRTVTDQKFLTDIGALRKTPGAR